MPHVESVPTANPSAPLSAAARGPANNGRGGAPARGLGAAVVLALALLIPGGAARARVVEKIAAVVGDNIILASEVEEKAAPMLTDVTKIEDPTKRSARATEIRHEVLDRLIDEELIVQQAAELRLTVSPEQIDASIAEIKKQNHINDDQLAEALRGQGMSMSTYRADLKRQLLRFRVINIAVGSKVNISDEDVRSYYNRHYKSDGSNVQLRASHIFVAIPDDADASVVAAKEAQARKLTERAKTEDFAKLAREFSDDTATKEDGGDLGYFGKDLLPRPIEELVFSMKVGEIRGPVRADRGFHVIKLVDRKVTDAKPLADVEDDIRMELRQKEMEKQTKGYLADLRKRTLVDVRY